MEGIAVPWRNEKANWKDGEMHVADILPKVVLINYL